MCKCATFKPLIKEEIEKVRITSLHRKEFAVEICR
jgi:hypothetical protein